MTDVELEASSLTYTWIYDYVGCLYLLVLKIFLSSSKHCYTYLSEFQKIPVPTD